MHHRWTNRERSVNPRYQASINHYQLFNINLFKGRIGTVSNVDKTEKRLLRALKGEVMDRPPVWLMRQAGRYLPEYRATRTKANGFLNLCYTPELAIEVTLQPIRRYGFDAAIMFSDILVVPDAMGADVSFVEGEGPKLVPIRTRDGIEKLNLDGLHAHLEPVYQTLKGLSQELPKEVALIGFAGAPWTLAAYMIEGGGSKDYQIARNFARQEQAAFGLLIEKLVDAITTYLERQVDSGAEVLQIFDSWAGVLAPDERMRWCIKPMAEIVRRLRQSRPQTPVIVFPRGVGAAYVDAARQIGSQGISLDTSIDPKWANAAIPIESTACLQGNLDPVALLAGGDSMRSCMDRIKEAFVDRAHIFNLGHGIVPQVPPEHVAQLMEHLNSWEK